jgi:hypothetical protein
MANPASAFLSPSPWDMAGGSVSIVFMEGGLTTKKLASLQAGEGITDFAFGINGHRIRV